MKKFISPRLIISAIIILLFFMLLIFPKAVFVGAKEGLILWFYTVFPTLFPFVIISNLMMQTNAISHITALCRPIISKLFRVQGDGAFAILAGFLCGYPMGAKVTADLVCSGCISKQEGQYLLSFCNNVSPMFIISYVVLQNLGDMQLVIPTTMILIGGPFLCSILFRHFHKPGTPISQSSHKEITFSFAMLDSSIMDSFVTVTKIGGYIIFFSVFVSILKLLFHENILLSTLEITGGIPMLMNTFNSYFDAYVPVLALTSFGGFCSIMQTQSMIQKASLHIVPYIIEKLITALVTSLFAYLFVYLAK